MDKLKKFGLMEKIVHELDDLRNTQQAILVKLGKIETDNMELGDKRLEKDLPDMHQRVSDNLDAIAGIKQYFADQTETYSDQNNIQALKDQDALNKLQS